MAYIIFVQPAVLGAAGMDFGAVLTATCLSTALATTLMALFANYPIAVAPAMGHNFFFAYSVVIGMNVPWRVALGAVAIAGETKSTNFLTQGAFQGSNGGGNDAFVTKLSVNGSALDYSTYLGGDKEERAYSLVLNGAGCAWVVGQTFS